MSTIQDVAYGIVPFSVVDEAPLYLLILHNKGHWGFPKGHQDDGETDVETARREFAEEVGIETCQIVDETQTISETYSFTKKKSGTIVDKTVIYYIGQVPLDAGTLATAIVQPEEISEYRWCTYEAAISLITFDAARTVLQQAHAQILPHLNSKAE